MTMAERIRQLRETASGNVSQRLLGKLARASPAYVGQLESGHVENPGVGKIAGIAEALGASVEYVLFGAGEPPSKEQIDAAVEAAKARLAPGGLF